MVVVIVTHVCFYCEDDYADIVSLTTKVVFNIFVMDLTKNYQNSLTIEMKQMKPNVNYGIVIILILVVMVLGIV